MGNEKDLEKKLEALEKLNKFVLLPAITNCLDVSLFNQTGILGNNPLRLWVGRKLMETDLPDEARSFLKEFLEKTDFSYRPLKR
jgi:hypothetical protein